MVLRAACLRKGELMDRPLRNLAELVPRSCGRFSERPAIGTKRDGQWRWTSYGELLELVERCRAGLHGLGVGRGDVVAIVANNSLDWAVTYYAAAGLEAVFVPMYEAQLPAEWKFILQDCGAKVVIARARQQLRAPARAVAGAYQRGPHDRARFASSRPELLRGPAGGRCQAPARGPRSSPPRGPACLIYTSGTTGNPKGVMLTHGNIASNVSARARVLPVVGADDRSLSFPPVGALVRADLRAARVLAQGASMALNDDITDLLSNLAEVKPTMLVSVPRIFNRIYDGVQQADGGTSRAVIQSAVRERPAAPHRKSEGRAARRRSSARALAGRQARSSRSPRTVRRPT